MKPQEVRFIVEELLENRIGFYPTYGNTLMGLAASVPLRPEDNFSVTYYAPQPRAVLRVVNPNKTEETVAYGAWGRVELTTMTKEFFMPRFLERDETIRRAPRAPYAWDGVGDVRPFEEARHKKFLRERGQLDAAPFTIGHGFLGLVRIHHAKHGARLWRVIGHAEIILG